MTMNPNLLALLTIKRDGRPQVSTVAFTFDPSAAMAPDDDTVEELVDVLRAIRGEDHPDWDVFRAAMVADHRLVARLSVERTYGLAGAP